MEDPEGVLSFDFEGGLDAPPSAATVSASVAAAPSGPIVQPNSYLPPSAASNGAAAPPVAEHVSGNVPGRRSFRQTVCRHWLRSLCMKGDACGFLHQYDKARMPVCRFFRLYGECREQDCVYKHTNEDIKECNMYKLGFCPNGPDCRYRHAKSSGPPPPIEEVLQKIQHLYSYNYNNSHKFGQQRGSSYTQQVEKSQFPQGINSANQGVVGKALAAESGNVLQQQQVQQPQQQVSQNQSQNLANGQPNQANRTSTPLPQGISRYFIVKSCNRENLELSVQQGVWATQRSNESKLNEAFDSVENVILVFSVNRTRHFQGCAKMTSRIGGSVPGGNWKYAHGTAHYGRNFSVKWLKLCELSFHKTRHLRNPYNENLPVKISRDCQELEPSIGEQLASLLYVEPDSELMAISVAAESKREEEKAKGVNPENEGENPDIVPFEDNEEEEEEESDEEEESFGNGVGPVVQGRGRGRGMMWPPHMHLGRGARPMPGMQGFNPMMGDGLPYGPPGPDGFGMPDLFGMGPRGFGPYGPRFSGDFGGPPAAMMFRGRPSQPGMFPGGGFGMMMNHGRGPFMGGMGVPGPNPPRGGRPVNMPPMFPPPPPPPPQNMNRIAKRDQRTSDRNDRYSSGPEQGKSQDMLSQRWGGAKRICRHRGVQKAKKKNSSRGTSTTTTTTMFHDMDGVQFGVKIGRDNPRIFSYAELFIGSNGFNEEQVLGSGGFGKVYKALLPSDGTLVAVKCCLSEKGKQFDKSFLAELSAVADLRHKNLVRLRGWCVHEDQLHLVYDYMPNRSLDRVLFRKKENSKGEILGWGQRCRIVKGLAAALYYLHEQLETQIIHRDVKTSNVMLDSHYNAKLGDFGMARWLEHELEYEFKYNYNSNSNSSSNSNKKTSSRIDHFKLGETSKIGGTIGYLPPESLQKPSNGTSKCDVFSFGIVVLEIVSGRRAIDLAYSDEKIILLDWIRRLCDEGKLVEAADTRLQKDGSSFNFSEMKHFIHIGLLCTLHDPNLRPNMKWVVEALSDLSFTLPSLPSFLSHPLYISLSSPSETTSPCSTSGTISAAENVSLITNYNSSTNYFTAAGETVYVTAENINSGNVSSKSMNRSHHRPNFPVVETPREISYKEIVCATRNFSESRRVAELDFGTAYHGVLDNDCHVLVKRLGMKTCPALRVRFSDELRNLGKLRHRNLVQLRGWCTEQGEMLVVYDYSASRILSQQLLQIHNKGENGSVLEWNYRYNIVKSLASAVHYLHEEWDEQVIHRNITSSAVILEQDMNPRLSSFALAEFLSRNEHGDHHVVNDGSKSVRGIFGYMSPEYVESGEATTAADVYSFGVVVLEVVSGQMAVDFRYQEVLLVKKVHEFVMKKRPLKELADVSLNGEYNEKEFMRLVRLGIACTSSDPELRPSMRQIVSILDGNDKLLNMKMKESREEWRERNASSLSMVRRIQALGIQ